MHIGSTRGVTFGPPKHKLISSTCDFQILKLTLLPQRLPPALTTKSNFQSLVLLTPFEFAFNFRLFYPTVHQSNEVFHFSGVLSLSLRRKSPVRSNWSTLNVNNSLNFRPIEIKKKANCSARHPLPTISRSEHSYKTPCIYIFLYTVLFIYIYIY